MGEIVVVGGGIAGITAALCLSARGQRVALVERTRRLGGLLGSTDYPGIGRFDFGTHFACETGVPELDSILLACGDDLEWRFHDPLLAGNYFGGALNEQSSCIDLRRLPVDLYRRAVVELLECGGAGSEPGNLGEEMESRYGATVARSVVAPVLRKLCGAELAQLAPGSHRNFDIARFIVLDPDATHELKRSPVFDARVAFHTADRGLHSQRACYPARMGLQHWVDALERKLESGGVRILKGRPVARVEHEGDKVTSVRVGRERISCDRLVWSIAPYYLLRLAGIDFESVRPPLLATTLHHLVFDRPFETGLFYVTCYDPDCIPFRVTLYPNFTRAASDRGFPCTVEIVHRGTPGAPETGSSLARELCRMGIVHENARIVCERTEHVRDGFPLPTIAFSSARAEQTSLAREGFSNVSLVGRGSGECFFMPDVVRETHRKMSAL